MLKALTANRGSPGGYVVQEKVDVVYHFKLQFNCLIVDDEPIAGDILNYCNAYPVLHVVANCSNAFEAKRILSETDIDILFLDIEMPVLNQTMAF